MVTKGTSMESLLDKVREMLLLYGAKLICTLTLLLLFAPDTKGEDTTAFDWIRSLTADLTTTQTAYSDSWVGGEAGSFNWVANVNGTVEKQLSSAFSLKSTLRLSYGQTITQQIIDSTGSRRWTRPQKSTDLIDWETVARVSAGTFVDPYVAFRVESQFFDGRERDKKLWLSPLKLTESVGLTRVFYKNEEYSVSSRFGFGLRQIIKTTITGRDTTVGPNVFLTVDSTLTDGGIESVTDATLSLHKNLRYTGKLTLFKALFFSGSDNALSDDWKTIDVNWENIINASITRIIAVNLYMQLLYDKEVNKHGRFKQTLGIGFAFKLL